MRAEVAWGESYEDFTFVATEGEEKELKCVAKNAFPVPTFTWSGPSHGLRGREFVLDTYRRVNNLLSKVKLITQHNSG